MRNPRTNVAKPNNFQGISVPLLACPMTIIEFITGIRFLRLQMPESGY